MFNKTCYDLGSAPSGIRELFAYGQRKAKEIGKENVFDFSIGNPSIPSPKKVNDSIKTILDERDSILVHGYSSSNGHESVRQAIADDLSQRYGCSVTADELFLTCGAAPALVAVAKALAADSDSEIMLIAPFFPEYIPFVTLNGAKAIVVPADVPSFQIDMEKLESLITEHTQAILINSPNNPSGVVYTAQTLSGIADILNRKAAEYGHPIYIISDEPYRELVYGGVEVPFVPSIYKNTIVCYSYSKSLSLPGERIGYIYVPSAADDGKELYAAVAGAARMCGHVCAPTLIQMAVEECVFERPDLEAYDENRQLLYNSLTEMGYECAKPDGAFYLFVKAPNGDAVEFSERAKLKYNLLVVPGNGFYCPGYMRISYCVSNDMIKRSLPAFKAMLEEYK